MKKLIIILSLILSFTCSFGQEPVGNFYLPEDSTFEYREGWYHKYDTLFLNGYKLQFEKFSYTQVEVIVGPGQIYLYPESKLLVKEDVPGDVKIWVIIPEEYKVPETPKEQKG